MVMKQLQQCGRVKIRHQIEFQPVIAKRLLYAAPFALLRFHIRGQIHHANARQTIFAKLYLSRLLYARLPLAPQTDLCFRANAFQRGDRFDYLDPRQRGNRRYNLMPKSSGKAIAVSCAAQIPVGFPTGRKQDPACADRRCPIGNEKMEATFRKSFHALDFMIGLYFYAQPPRVLRQKCG